MSDRAPEPDAGLSLGAWSACLADPAVALRVNRRFYGRAVRTDRWRCRQISRDEHMVYLVLDGEITGAAAGRPFVLRPGTLFWLSPHVPHDMTWPARLEFTEVWFRLEREARAVPLPEPVLVVEGAGETLRLLQEIEDELTLDSPWCDRKLRHLLAMLALDVDRLRQQPRGGRLLNAAQRRRLLAFARQHLADRPSVGELAACAGLSPDYFSRVFARTFGCSPRDWLVRERVREAGRLLTTTNLAVYQVAEQLGYVNVSQFHRQFRRHAGLSPHRYRTRRHG